MNRVIKGLSKAFRKRQLVRIDRSPITKGFIDGYVVGVSEVFILLHVLDPNMYLNGYSAVRVEDIKSYRILDDYNSFADRALKLRGIEPVPQPDILLSDLPSLLSSANECYPLITIYREKLDDEVCFIGRVKKLTEKTVTLEEIDPAARWKYTRRYRFNDITRIDFGGGYENALALVAEHEVRAKVKGEVHP